MHQYGCCYLISYRYSIWLFKNLNSIVWVYLVLPRRLTLPRDRSWRSNQDSDVSGWTSGWESSLMQSVNIGLLCFLKAFRSVQSRLTRWRHIIRAVHTYLIADFSCQLFNCGCFVAHHSFQCNLGRFACENYMKNCILKEAKYYICHYTIARCRGDLRRCSRTSTVDLTQPVCFW